jgi:aspartate/methionine/tyrosine aminotransferase
MRLSREVEGVTESPLIVIGTLAESMPGAIKLCYGESDTPTPEFISRAAYDAALAGHTFYTNTAGYTELREAIAHKVHELHGAEYRPTEVMVTVGATMAVFIAVRASLGSGDNAVVITPAYSTFVNAVVLSGAEAREVPLARDASGFHLDLDRVRAAIDGRTRMLIVNSPSNPTGWIISDDERRALYELAIEHDLTILADEVYERLIFGKEKVARSFATLVDKDRVIVVNSFSKTYNMTGWRLGWLQASERLVRAMASGAEFITSNATSIAQQAGIIALRDGEAYVAEYREHLAKRRDQVVAALSAMPGLSLNAPGGAFFAFPRVDALTDSAAFAETTLRKTGVALTPGSAFGAGGEGHVRLCFAASEATLAEALKRLSSLT